MGTTVSGNTRKAGELEISAKLCTDASHAELSSLWEPATLSLRGNSVLIMKAGILLKKLYIQKGTKFAFEQGEQVRISFLGNKFKHKTWVLIVRSVTDYLALENAVYNSKRPKWTSTGECELCPRDFSLFRRRHHCRYCGRSVCKHCAPYFTEIPEMAYSHKVRICEECCKTYRLKHKEGALHASKLLPLLMDPRLLIKE